MDNTDKIKTTGRRMSRALLGTQTSPRTIGELHLRFKEANIVELKQSYPWASRFVMGYPLPSWQRGSVWTGQQQSRFIASIWADIDVGSYLVNDTFATAKNTKNGSYVEHSDILLDGQQRLTALENYFRDEIAVSDKDGTACYWSELDQEDQRYFKNRVFARSTVNTFDETVLRNVYDLRNFGGTPHKISERATDSIVSE